MVIGWLTRVTVALAVLGVLLFDGSALIVGRVSVADHADAAAQAAAASWRAQHSLPAALLAAQNAAGSDEVVPGSLEIDASGTATVRLHRTIDTLLLGQVPGATKLLSVDEVGRGDPPLS